MSQDATIISATLDTKELQASINEMVNKFDQGLQKMLDHTNSKVTEINNALKQISNATFDSKGSKDGVVGNTSKQAQKQDEVTKAVERTIAAKKEEKATYDQTAQAMQEAIKPKSARESYIAFQKGFKAQADAITQQIKLAEEALNKAIARRVDELNGKIANAKNKLNELFVTLEKAKQQQQNTGNYSQFQPAITRTQQQIENTLRYIDELKRKIADTPSMFNTSDYLQTIERLKAERERVSNIMKEEVSSQQRIEQNTQQQLSKEEQITKEIQQQAKAIRESEQWKKEGRYLSGNDVYYDKDRANATKREKEQMLTLEEQILQKMVLREESERKIAQASRETNAALEQIRGKSGAELGWGRVQDMQARANAGGISTQAKEIDYLRQQISAILDIKEQDVQKTNLQIATYNKMSAYLKQLQDAYHSLSADNLKREGSDIANEIQRVTRAMQQFQAQMNRPTSLKNVLGLDEKTLDDIAYKMQMLQRYRSGLNVDTQRNEINQVNQAYDRLKAKMDEVMAKSAQMNTVNNALARSFNYMKNRLAFYFTVGASTAFLKQLIDIRSQYELTERSLGILVNSAERGSRIFNELSQMALVSPYTLIELSNAAKQLTAYGVAAKDVVDTTRRLADISAAVGAPVERIAYALGHVQSYGYLTSLQARQFANNGIPLVKELANRYSELEEKLVTTSDVYDRMKKKQVSYADVMGVVNKLTDDGGRFFDFQAKQAETLRVRLSNLNLQLNNMYNEMGKSTGGVISGAIKLSATMFKNWRSIARVLGTVVTAIGVYRTSIALATLNTKMFGITATKSFLAAITGANGARNAVFLFATALKSIPFAWWATAVASVLSYFVWFNKSGDETKQKLDEIQSAFRGVRNEIDNLFVNSIKSNNLGTQLSNLKDMLDLAESELGVTIPINIEKVNESDVKQTLKDTKKTIEDYIGFAQLFSEEAVGSKFNESMNEYGSAARKVYYSITESINSTITSLQELSDKGKASKREIEILNELIVGQKEDESKVEYLQRLVKLYEELGLLSEKTYSAKWWSFSGIGDNFDELQDKQGKALDRLEVKNKEIYSSMLDDIQQYYSSSSIAAYQFELQVARVAKKIDIDNIPISQRTLKLQVAINEEASQNNWNEFEKEFAYQIANTKYGTQIQISSDSKKEAELELSDWQKRMQDWCNKNKIEIKFDFQEEESEKSYRDRILQEAKDAKEDYLAKRRQAKIGTATKEDEEAAEKEYKNAREKARLAGADLSSLDKEKKKKDALLDSLKTEISLVEKLQGDYEKLTKAGLSSQDALEAIHNSYGSTIDLLNKKLQGFGLPRLDLSMITGKNPNEHLNYFKELKTLLESKGLANLERIKAIDAVIEKLNVKAETYNLDMVTKGLNNELGKLKDEYELAVELDANPELGGIFADMMGLSKEEIESLPRDFEGVVRKMQSIMDDQLGVGRFDVRSNLNKKMFEQWLNTNNIDLESSLGQRLNAFVEQGNKIRQDEAKKQVEEWNKLLEKYATYEYKKMQIQIQHEKEMREARKKGANADIMQSIENWRKEQLAQLELEQFQKTPDWIVATGDLAGLSNKALQMLIDSIEEYKRKANNLTPKQIKQINEALKKLRNEQRNDNPLAKLSILFDEVASKASVYEDKIKELTARYDELNEKQKDGENLTAAERKEFSSLGSTILDLKDKLKEVKKVSAVDIVDALNSIEKTATQAGGAIAEMIGAFGDKENAEALQNIMGAFDKAADWAKMGAAIAGPWGAAIGAVAGLVTGMVSFLAESISGNAKITKQVEASERSLKRLESTFSSLEAAANNAYGAVVEGLQRATVESKKLQLAEIQRQLQLEQSRREKYKDEDKIIDLQSKVRDLRREIEEGSQDIINNLLNISSAGDGVTQLVQTMIDAFRNGEDAMEAFGNKWDEMIDNMILKLIVTEYMQRGWDKLMENLNKMEDEFLGKISQDKAQAQSVLESMEGLTKEEQKKAMADFLGIQSLVGAQNVISDEALEMWINALKQQLEAAENSIYDASVEFDKWALEYMSTEGKSFMENWAKGVSDILPEYYTFGENNAGQLSNLQQGIQGITEDTASALEAMLNGISQQVYGHTALLTEIRDIIHTFDFDVQLGLQGEMLLQLQNGHQTMMAMKTMMENWQTPSGNGIRVEML